jgi:hypothetical protein
LATRLWANSKGITVKNTGSTLKKRINPCHDVLK